MQEGEETKEFVAAYTNFSKPIIAAKNAKDFSALLDLLRPQLVTLRCGICQQ